MLKGKLIQKIYKRKKVINNLEEPFPKNAHTEEVAENTQSNPFPKNAQLSKKLQIKLKRKK